MLPFQAHFCEKNLMMLEAALAYASQGFHVFPILPGLKKPLTKHGFKEATTDPEQIRAWWGANPTANIGWWLDGSSLCAIDVDIGAASVEGLPLTMTVSTPSGGFHLIYEGRIPSTQSKLAAHVDTRGVGGYTILPPSMVDGRTYEWVNDEWPAPVPQWIVEFFATAKPEPRHTDKRIDEIDTPERIAKVREIAASWPPATEYQGSNDATIELTNRLLDLCSHDHVLNAMWVLWVPRCTGEWTVEWLTDKVWSVQPGSGRDSDIGCEDYPIEYGYKPEWDKRVRRARFAWQLPKDFDDKDPEFWDPKTKMIPRGGIVLVYGQSSSHKTNITLTLLFDMMENGARNIYAAGEGSRGVKKYRIPAHVSFRGVDFNAIDRLAVVSAVPLLQNGGDVREFIDMIKDFKPDIVVIDTLATATAGLDENNSVFSALLTDNGAVGTIRSELGCTLIIVAHEGKNAERGARGHSGLSGNVDAAINVVFKNGIIEAHVTKMRDGQDNFSMFAKIVYVAGVPVPVWCELKVVSDTGELWPAWYEALGVLGKPSKLTEVLDLMINTRPHLAASPDALRKQLQKGAERMEACAVGWKGNARLYKMPDLEQE
jgi:hypothetical protein